MNYNQGMALQRARVAEEKKAKKTLSLSAFAKARAARPPQCRICALDPLLRREVDAGIKAGVSTLTIALWLKENGKTIGETTVRRHRRNHVEAV